MSMMMMMMMMMGSSSSSSMLFIITILLLSQYQYYHVVSTTTGYVLSFTPVNTVTTTTTTTTNNNRLLRSFAHNNNNNNNRGSSLSLSSSFVTTTTTTRRRSNNRRPTTTTTTAATTSRRRRRRTTKTVLFLDTTTTSGEDSTSSSPGEETSTTTTTTTTTTTSSLSSSSLSSEPLLLTDQQCDFVIGYLNKHHNDLIILFVKSFSTIGIDMASANTWSGGSYTIENAKLIDIITINNNNDNNMKDDVTTTTNNKKNTKTTKTTLLKLEATIQKRNKPIETQIVEFSIDIPKPVNPRNCNPATTLHPPIFDDPDRLPIDDIVRRLCRLCWIVDKPEITGKLIQLGIQLDGAGVGKLPENMYLNQVPHNRYVRDYFYECAANAVMDAVILCSQKQHTNRMRIISQFPEMNPSMDSYRIGTILEMARSICLKLATGRPQNKLRVRLCVQGSMGVGIFTGVPKQLNGVSRLIQMMDWGNDPGEENEGIVGEYIRFGSVGPEHVMNDIYEVDPITGEDVLVQHMDDVYVIIAPQSMVGTDSSIIPLLEGMVHAAGDRPIILINDDLTDKRSAAGQQSVIGRQERIRFSDSFEIIYQFQNIYVSGTSYFPILGAITKNHPKEPYIVHQRRDYATTTTSSNDRSSSSNEKSSSNTTNKSLLSGEVYVPILVGESEPPDGQIILDCFER